MSMNANNAPEPELDSLYREVILEHYRDPRGRERLEHETARAEGLNPSCGDEVDMAIHIENGRCTGIHVDSMGCAISVASGSILFDLVENRPLEEVRAVLAAVRQVLHGGEMPEEPDLGDFDALEGVKQFPVRIKCALLPWTTLEEALRRAEEQATANRSST